MSQGVVSEEDITVTTDEVLIVPLPGQAYDAAKPQDFSTEEFIITAKTTRNELRARLADYNLPISGTRSVLVQRLREFANDHNAWLSLFRPQKKRNRGVHTARDSLSTRRIAEQFGAERETLVFESKKSVSRTQRALDDNDRAANNSWAQGVLKAFGIDNDLNPIPRKRLRTSYEPPTRSGTSTSTMMPDSLQVVPTISPSLEQPMTISPQLPVLDPALLTRICRIERNILSARENVSQRLDNIEDLFTARLTDLSNHLRAGNPTDARTGSLDTAAMSTSHCHGIPSSVAPNPTRHPLAGVPHAPQPSASLLKAPQVNTTPADNLAKVQLGNEVFCFDKRNVPDPPSINFSKDLGRLFREWEESSLLCIEGRNIPIKHWPEFYKKSKGFKANAWSALRTKWDNWKFIVTERQAHPDDASFWHKFTLPNGQRLGYQKILDKLRDERNTLATEHAVNARAFFHGDLDHPNAGGAFRYIKSGKSAVCTEDDTVAQRWLTLLQDRPDIASQWAAMRTTHAGEP